MNLLPIEKHSAPLPGVIDLFSGCGGLAAGFDAAGFPMCGGVDIDRASADTARYNLHNRYGRLAGHTCGDLTCMTADDILLSRRPGERIIMLGGPPCQAYSRAGRGKLRSLGTEHMYDPRGMLYKDYIRLCTEMDVDTVVMENVPEAIDFGGLNIPEITSRKLEDLGYTVGWTILNAADYGVPQVRERLFLIAVRKDICNDVSFPAATHRPPEGIVSAWTARRKRLAEHPHYICPPESSEELRPWVTVGEALSDLPSLFPSASGRYQLHQPNVAMPYSSGPRNAFQIEMRQWYESDMSTVSGNSFRNTARDFPIFERMLPGNDFRHVAEISEKMFSEACRAHGITEEGAPERFRELRKKIVPPYAREKFHEKWKRLNSEKPSHTVVAHLSVDTYSHIHPWEPRGISVREAARLQSFPDGFLFQGCMGEAFKQIGNAVPPLLSKALATHLKNILLEMQHESSL
jgi:DNA (cytosine-5)-methyltransferase 1